MVSIFCKFSKLSAFFTKIPYWAALPVPTIIATGVAKPKAHGQETTSTLIAQVKAKVKSAPASIHIISVAAAIPMTIGTNTPATLSATLAIGALELPASSTRRIIFASVVSSPTLVASKRKVPLVLIVAEITSSPARLVTGRLSPVMADWSRYPTPSITLPSTGMLSPGRITTISPFVTSSLLIVISLPLRITCACLGAKSTNLLNASPVFAFDKDSRYLPTLTKATIIAAESKYIPRIIAECAISIFILPSAYAMTNVFAHANT